MSFTSMGKPQQVVQPPQRGIFPLDHDAACRDAMEIYLQCLHGHRDQHHQCRDNSKAYLQCRMDHDLMARETLDQLGYSAQATVRGAREYDAAKERAGFVAGKHIQR